MNELAYGNSILAHLGRGIIFLLIGIMMVNVSFSLVRVFGVFFILGGTWATIWSMLLFIAGEEGASGIAIIMAIVGIIWVIAAA